MSDENEDLFVEREEDFDDDVDLIAEFELEAEEVEDALERRRLRTDPVSRNCSRWA